MTEQEFTKEVQEIKGELKQIAKNTHGSVWRSFANGLMSGIGYIVGAAIALTIIGYILNYLGIIPAFKNELHSLQATLDNLSKLR